VGDRIFRFVFGGYCLLIAGLAIAEFVLVLRSAQP